MKKIKIYSIEDKNGVQNAEKEAKELWQWAMDESYKKLSKEEMEDQLTQLAANLNENGLLQLIDDDPGNIPTDCFIDLALKPTYVAASIFIYAYNAYPEIYSNSCYLKSLRRALQGCLTRKLMDHGYEAEEGKLKNILLFSKCGLFTFVQSPTEECNEFCSFMKNEIKNLESELTEHKKKGKEYTIFGFEPICVSNLVQEILDNYRDQ